MIPVRLQLENFLSYGENAPVLDFDAFQVVCLSGRNGQGKSALLDAITWALWGEARKGSGSRKPDDDLLRIGAHSMKVDLTFDLEGERYRVIRGYRRSPTGKTTRPMLEVQVFDAATEGFRPLTAGSVNATQALLKQLLGLDYNTFINSAFLLQGRSDEFTRKNAGERKAILGRILDLSKYDRLAKLARERQREAQGEVEVAEREIDRLEEHLSTEATIRNACEETAKGIAQAEQILADQKGREAELSERLAAYTVHVERAKALREQIQRADNQLQRHAHTISELQGRVEGARELIAQAERIQADLARKRQLEGQRDTLEKQREQFDLLSEQIRRDEQRRDAHKHRLEQALAQLKSVQEGDRRLRREIGSRLDRLPVLQRQLADAAEAEAEVKALAKLAERVQVLTKRKQELEAGLHAARKALETRLTDLQTQLREAEARMPDPEALRAEVEQLTRNLQEIQVREEELEQVADSGKQLSAQIEARLSQINAWQDEITELKEQMALVRQAAQGRCPTCGTEMNESHRRTVLETFQSKVKALAGRIQAAEAQSRRQAQERDALRQRFKELRPGTTEKEKINRRLVEARHQLETRDRQIEEVCNRRELIQALRVQLDRETFAEEQRTQWLETRKALEDIDFDERPYHELLKKAHQAESLRTQIGDLEAGRDQYDQLKVRIEQREQEIEQAGRQLQEELQPMLEEIKAHKRERDAVGFDRQHLDRIKRQLEPLANAERAVADLENAERNVAAWKTDLDQRRQQQTGLQAERQEAQAALGALQEGLQSYDHLKAQQNEVIQERTATEQELARMRTRLGQIQERLNRLDESRRLKKVQREARRAARTRMQRYGHLKTAFSKNGIPSLIIEQALPEIEHRANEILYRLSDGRTQVKLETLKDKKSGGGTIETLDIRITDELGVARPYETFSGGEAFRVNFALRIALSQMLAERSGVRIQTLVIDEGFGTQDAEGVQNLVQAIDTIREDFAKVIVITHLKELKEAFAVRIEVEKHPVEGSTFEVVGVA